MSRKIATSMYVHICACIFDATATLQNSLLHSKKNKALYNLINARNNVLLAGYPCIWTFKCKCSTSLLHLFEVRNNVLRNCPYIIILITRWIRLRGACIGCVGQRESVS